MRISAEDNQLTTGFLLNMPDSIFRVEGVFLLVESDQICESPPCTGTRRATLWVQAGTVKVTANAVLEINGGDDPFYNRAIIEVAGELLSDVTIFEHGYAAVDVIANKFFKAGDVTFQAGCIATKTGAGTVKSGS
jgi:hypothetical protein